jgi:hypothetical protein
MIGILGSGSSIRLGMFGICFGVLGLMVLVGFWFIMMLARIGRWSLRK